MNKKLISVLIAIIMILFILLFLDFVALHDIKKEYVSTNILGSLNVQLSETIPDWVQNSREWNYLTLSLLLKSGCYTSLLLIIVFVYHKQK